MENSALMLLNGGALSHRMYKDMVPILTAYGYAVIVPDLPGHGQSTAAGVFTFEKATEYLRNIFEDLKKHFSKITLVGVSLGGQAVLDILQRHPKDVDCAVVSGASIHPEDEKAQWEMPHVTEDKFWKEIITEVVNQMGMQHAASIQQENFSFTFQPPQSLPPVLAIVGEHDTAMARRDIKELGDLLVAANAKSQVPVMKEAWHNHPIEVPQRFADVIHQWVKSQIEN